MPTGHVPRLGFLLLLISLGSFAALGQTDDRSLPNLHTSASQGFASQLAELRLNSYAYYFGRSVAVGADTVAVGTPFSGGANTAFVFVEPRSGWSNISPSAFLVPSDGGDPSQNFGASIAVSEDGSTVVVGASQYNDYFGTSVGPGKLYVFVRPPGGWLGPITEIAQLSASDGMTGDALGFSVSINGSTIVGGAPGSPPYDQPTAAYVFVEPAGGWKTSTQTARLSTIDGLGRVGTSVSISGNTIAVGAPYSGAGTVALFVEPAGGWVNMTPTAELTSAGQISGGLMGSSVAINGPLVAAGGPSASVGSNQYEGAVYIFAEPPGGWVNATQSDVLIEPDGKSDDGFGSAVAMTSNTIVVGSPYYTRGFNTAFWVEGAAFALAKSSGGWSCAPMHGADARYYALLGASVGISGREVVTGAPDLGHAAGSVYVFELQ